MVHDFKTQVKFAAITYAKMGWSVFPTHSINGIGHCTCGKTGCSNPGKHPATKRGFKDASPDPEVVDEMFNGKIRNLAVATGAPSGFWILDLDGPEGIEHLDRLQQQHGSLPETVSAQTGGGGRHLLYRHDGMPIKTSNKIEGLSIDCRGDGGYAVIPPSMHVSSKRYDWIVSPDDRPIADAPRWLVEFVNGTKTHSKPESGLNFTIGGIDDGLATAPGATQGQRHSTATRLIGSEIGRGTDPTQVAMLAIVWGMRCDPPMPESEILRIVGDLSRKDGTRITTADETVLDQPLPEPMPWPEMHEDAYHGLAGEIVRTIEPHSEADPVGILIQMLISYGNLVGRGPHFVVEGTKHHANAYAVLVGDTARGRKGTSEGRVRSVLRNVDEQWVTECIKTGLVSGEGLIWNVRDPIFKLETIKDKGKPIGTVEVCVDGGIVDKRLLCQESEFASVLRVCGRETNTLSAILRSAWDTGHLRTLAKNSPAKSTDAHVSMAGHITIEELRAALTECDRFNGFGNRFLWSVVRRSKLLPDGGGDLDLTDLSHRLATAAANAGFVDRMYRDDSATALWRNIYTEMASDPARGLIGAISSRAEAQVLRLSLIYSLMDDLPGTITARHLRAAYAVWRYCRASVELIFGSLASDPVEDAVLDAIRTKPGVTRTELHRMLGGHIKAAALRTVLVRLRDSDSIRAERIDTGGRPAEQWYASDQGLSSLNSLNSQACEPTQQQDQGLTSLNSLNSHPIQNQQQPKAGEKEFLRI